MATILLVAALFRFHALDAIPPGLTHDEADVGFYAAAFARGERAEYDVPYGYAYEPYGRVSAGLLMRALGATDLALRAHQALYGLLVVGLTYVWARAAFGRFVALSAAALAAVLFWIVFTSRMALNSQPAPAVFLVAVIALWRALYGNAPGRGRMGWWVVFALAVAAMLHVYEATRAAWFAFPAFLIYLLLADRNRLRRRGPTFALALGVGTALALPHLLDPGAWGRTDALGGAVSAFFSGAPGPLVTNALQGLGTLTVSGDTLITYNLPGQPVLWPLLAAFFYLGLAVGVARVRQPAYAFLLLWLAFGLVPTLVIGAYTSTLHSIVVQPAVCLLPAIGAAWLAARPATKRLGRYLAALWVAALLLTAGITWRDYFAVWGEAADVRAAYFHTLAAITARVDADPGAGVVTISSPFPEPPLDPFIGALRIREGDADVRWMDARRAVLLPPADDARLFASADAPLDPLLADLLDAAHVERVTLRPNDLNPHYDVFRLRPLDARARLAEVLQPREGAVFGGALAMAACHVAVRDGAAEVVTLWAVRDPDALGAPPLTQYAHALTITVQALDAAGAVIGQEDALGAPAAGWRAGDMFLHVHRFALPDPLPPGPVQFIAGVYDRASLARLPLTLDGQPAGDALTLSCLGP
ncbi:MAG: glycosyltransferase family 39 protein [Anaerolineae bacterium]|nr:glycosyltransferase family 39 protein [Anaerolineae bacterium]